ncbi:response regulator transcription factor [Thalassobacillus hwangdonensis]|uniref:Response regulator transcription factor n=1 Tax=Thalassobacillus hwangdonensis TaxID=546108 RepID=A0ABW3L550_9BACI
MNKLLIVDDEQRMVDLLQLYLEPAGFYCDVATNGDEALRKLDANHYDLVLLDIMMPGTSGWEVCRKVRLNSRIPIIMITAREQKEDIIKGLRLGADDYITKPFDSEELIARIEALLRRTGVETMLEVDGLIWDETNHNVSYQKKDIRLTPKEFSILGYVMRHPGRVYEREQLIELIWGFEAETEGRTIDSHVRNMREKIRKSGFPIDSYFTTVWGVGYKWLNQPKHQ